MPFSDHEQSRRADIPLWGGAHEVDALALWTPPNRSPSGVASFAANEADTATAGMTWRIYLTSDSDHAERQLTSAETSVMVADKALAESSRRIDTLLASYPAAADTSTFAVETPLPAAEQELLGLLHFADSPQPEVAFALGIELPGNWQEANEDFYAFLRKVERFLRHYAWVESEIDGKLIGRTTVNWLADMRTTWHTDTHVAQRALHRRALASALDARATLLRTVALISAGAITLLPILTAGTGAIVALPAVWRFFNQVRSELKQRSLTDP
ncbi:MAG: hypothetical protein GY759_04825 [Chloroflexi bacterium]|nr:hypothetical protein [Chloroflexota bacterium]